MSQTESSGLLRETWFKVFIPLSLSVVFVVAEEVKYCLKISVNWQLVYPLCVCMCVCLYLCLTLSVWALQPGSAGSRGLVPRQAPPECDCRQPRWCSCPEAPSIHSLMPYCPGAPGAQSLTLSEGTQSFSPFKMLFCTVFMEGNREDDTETGY